MRNLFLVLFVLIFTVSSAIAADNVTIIGIVGGTGAGKTTIAKKLQAKTSQDTVIISQDSYYKDLSLITKDQSDQVNFDHPDSIEFDLLKQHLSALKDGKSIEVPTYDFTTHSRSEKKTIVHPKKVIILEGILLLAVPEIRDLIDIKIFVDVEDDVRLFRRIKRDIEERGRTISNIEKQYFSTVKPMHQEFVAPSRQYADMIVPHGAENPVAINILALQLQALIQAGK